MNIVNREVYIRIGFFNKFFKLEIERESFQK
jgi:hypothetical protein